MKLIGSQFLIYGCIILWGISTFLNKLSVERMPPLLMQTIVGAVYIFYIPIAFRLSGESITTYKWSSYSLILTSIATIGSICANVILYMSLKGNNTTGSSTMFVSLYPVVTLMLSYIFLNEQFTTTKVCGVLAMIFGAVLLSIK